MKVLKADNFQYITLNNFQNGPHKLEFVQTEIGWIVGLGVLDNPYFDSIKAELLRLELVDYEPLVDF